MSRLKTFLVFAGLTLTLSFATPVAAQLANPVSTQQDNAFRQAAGYAPANKMSLNFLIANIIQWVLSFLGVIFVALVIYAGILWMTSAGNEEKIEQAKKIMSAAVIGLVIVLAAYMITFFVIDQVLDATQGQRLP